jgi:hypothetical protein
MKARWVFQHLEPELPGVGMATVASKWPGTYWLVSTVQLDESSVKNYGSQFLPTVEFIQPMVFYGDGLGGGLDPEDTRCTEIKRKVCVPIGKAIPKPGKFVTQIYKYDTSSGSPFYNAMNWLGDAGGMLKFGQPSYRNGVSGVLGFGGIGLFGPERDFDRPKNGVIHLDELPLFEREYSSLSDARAWHKEIVDYLAHGGLKLVRHAFVGKAAL